MPAQSEISVAIDAKTEMRRDAQRFHDLNHSGLLALVYFNLTGEITFANDAFLQLVDYSQEELERREVTWKRITPPPWLRVIEKVMDDLSEDRRCGRHELQFCRRDGSCFWGLFQAARIATHDTALAFVQDVTVSKELEQDLQEMAAMLDRAQRIGGMGHWVYEVAPGQLTWSAQAREILLGAHPDHKSNLIESFHPSDRQAVSDHLVHSVATKNPLKMSARVVRPDGTERVVYLEADLDLDSAGEPSRLIGVVHDVTDRTREHEALVEARSELEWRVMRRTQELAISNDALQKEIADRQQSDEARVELLRRVVTAQEDERRRIARELHDQMGQLLAALMLGMKWLEATDGLSEAAQNRILLLRNIANDVGHEIHELALELRPTALDDLGLSAALCQYVETWSNRSNIEADIHVGGMEGERLPLPLELALYRIIQEALTNVVKHAQAHHVSIVLERRADQLSMIVEDDGVGFDLGATLKSPSAYQRLGLLGIRERLATLGGALEVESDLQHGTTLYVRVPLPVQSQVGI